MIRIRIGYVMGGTAVWLAALLAACDGGETEALIEREEALRATSTVAGHVASQPAKPIEPTSDMSTAVSVATSSDTAPEEVSEAPSPVKRQVTFGEAEAAYRDGRYGEAVELFHAYTDARPENGWGHYMLGLSAWKAGDLETAEESLSRAAAIDAGNVKAWTNLGRVLLELDLPGDAVVAVEEALRVNPDSHEVWRVLGNAKAEMGLVDEALDAYRQALILAPEDAWTMNNYGLLLIQLERFEEAVPPLARAVEIQPGSAMFQNNLGIALERSGELVAALHVYEAAIQADASHARAQNNFERVHARLAGIETEPVDLSAFAASFAYEIQSWRTPGTTAASAR